VDGRVERMSPELVEKCLKKMVASEIALIGQKTISFDTVMTM
jgi:hypothetical protein